METINLRSDIKMPWGKNLQMYYRWEPVDGFNDWNVIEASLNQDEYQLDKLPFERGVGIDIGAHIGGVSIRMAAMGMKVFSVEMIPENAKLLQSNIDLNGFTDLVKVYPRAISAKDNDKLYGHYGNTTTSSGRHHNYIGSTDTIPHPQEGTDIIEVKCVSLNTIFRENKITRCNILKTDCEGGEWDCFEGASKKTISKIDWIVAKLHSTTKHRGTKQELLELIGNTFEDITSQYIEDMNVRETHCILRNKSL
jgi:FkbM family methyltransferase